MQFGSGLNNQPLNTLFFVGDPGAEAHGIDGRIDRTPEPASWLLASVAAMGVALALRVKRG
jgi:hypothetical protein